MPRPAKPWWWEERQAYFIKINGKRIRLSEDKKEANQLFHKLKSEPEAPKLHSDSVIAIIDAFLDDTSKTKAEATYDWYKSFLEPFANTVKQLRVHQLKPFHVKDWLAKGTWSTSTQRGAITAVKRCFHWAMKEGRIKENPVAYMEKPEAGKRDVIISPAEFKQLLALVRDQQFRDLLEFAWETGARPQEVYALGGFVGHQPVAVILLRLGRAGERIDQSEAREAELL
jgi:integrase